MGDICLQKVGAAISQKLQKYQYLIARYAGEKFAVIMPYTPGSKAIHIAEAMQASVRDLQIVHSWSAVSQYVTLSMGAASTIPTWESSPSDLVVVADKSLYQAKVDGRNRCISYS